MHVLVTGSNGFLGSALVARLLQLGERVRCFVRPGSNTRRLEALQKKYSPEGFSMQIFRGSLSSKESLDAALKDVKTVYHLAAAMSGPAAEMCLNTVVPSKRLLEAVVASSRPIRIVLVSSFSVYGVAGLPRGALISEQTPLEAQARRRDAYAQTKLRQEQLFWEYQRKHDLDIVVVRPGVIYGPGGGAFSSRVGLKLFGLFLNLGGRNLLPLTYVDNCADAIANVGRQKIATGEAYNVHDDEMPTCQTFLDRYKKEVQRIRSIRLPYFVAMMLSKFVERYSAWSKGQLPPILTPYKTATTWKAMRFTNAKIKKMGWKQPISTAEGMKRTFAYLKENLQTAK